MILEVMFRGSTYLVEPDPYRKGDWHIRMFGGQNYLMENVTSNVEHEAIEFLERMHCIQEMKYWLASTY